jgi:hypothetical protein
MLGDPSLRYVRARVLEADDKTKDAFALASDPKQWITSYGPCWAIRGRLERAGASGHADEAAAKTSFVEAVAHDPFGVEAACESLDPAAPLPAEGAPLCEAARARKEPDLGRD